MKTQLVTTLALLLTTNVNGNIFKNIQDKMKRSSVNLDNFKGIEKVQIPNTNMYYYKLSKTDPTQAAETSQASVVVESYPVLDHPVVVNDHPRYDPVISKTPKTKEVGAQIEQQEIDHVYGKNSPLRDDAVASAWRKAREAEERLESHREYMEKLRKLRLEKAAAKEIDGAKNDD